MKMNFEVGKFFAWVEDILISNAKKIRLLSNNVLQQRTI